MCVCAHARDFIAMAGMLVGLLWFLLPSVLPSFSWIFSRLFPVLLSLLLFGSCRLCVSSHGCVGQAPAGASVDGPHHPVWSLHPGNSPLIAASPRRRACRSSLIFVIFTFHPAFRGFCHLWYLIHHSTGIKIQIPL